MHFWPRALSSPHGNSDGEGKKIKKCLARGACPLGCRAAFLPQLGEGWGAGEGGGRGRDHVGKAIKFPLPALLSNGCPVCVPSCGLHSGCIVLFAELPLGGGCSSTVPPNPPPQRWFKSLLVQLHVYWPGPPLQSPPAPSCSAQLHQGLGTEVKMRSPCMLLISSLSACNRRREGPSPAALPVQGRAGGGAQRSPAPRALT